LRYHFFFSFLFYCLVIVSSGGDHNVPIFTRTSYETIGVIQARGMLTALGDSNRCHSFPNNTSTSRARKIRVVPFENEEALELMRVGLDVLFRAIYVLNPPHDRIDISLWIIVMI
jgi:hypothetical protein